MAKYAIDLNQKPRFERLVSGGEGRGACGGAVNELCPSNMVIQTRSTEPH